MVGSGTVATLALAGAVVGLDSVSFPQAMLSRPVVAATVGGAMCGNASAGLLVGLLLECFALETMPFGASRYPEWGPASLAAGVIVAVPGGDTDATARLIPFAVLAGLAAAMIAGWSLIWLRKLNLALAARYRIAIASGDPKAIVGLQHAGLVADFVRAGLTTTTFVVLLVPARDAILLLSKAPGALALTLTATLAVGVAGGAFWKVVHTTRGYAWWLLAGVLTGLAIVVLR